MYGNNKQKQNEHPAGQNAPEGNLQEPQQPQLQPAGNESANANFYTQMLRQANEDTGNDFLAGLIEEGLDLADDGGNNKENPDKDGDKPKDVKDAPKENVNNIINNIIKVDNSGIGEEKPNLSGNLSEDVKNIPENNINNKIAPKDKEEKKDPGKELKASEAAKEPAKVLQKAVEDIFPDQMAEIEDFYKDPEPDQQEDDYDDPLNTSMIVHRPKTRNLKKKKKDLKKAAAPMERIKGLNVAVQKLPARQKTGWWSRVLTGTAWYAGKTIGKAINWLANLFILPWFSSKKKKRAFSKSTENPLLTQEKKTHDVIPGWGEERYQKEPGREDNIIADFRRVPTVWSFLTAGKAADENGKPLPPKISVNVNQPEAGKDKDISMSGSGHTGIGIEYSRYSRVSNRYERYGLKYGFGIADETASAGILNATKGAKTFGQLWDEKNREFDVTRTFPATSKQVNDILKASETWADGGYNLLTRNCTTFVKHLVRDVAHLPVGDQIFQTKVPDLNSAANFLGFAGVASETNAKLGMESSFAKLAGQDDLSYAGLGNKRATKEDYKIFKESMDPDASWDNEVDLPNGAAENMRRMEGPDSGILSSSGYTSEKLKDPQDKSKLNRSFYNYRLAILEEKRKVKTAILRLAGKNNEEELLAVPGIPGEMVQIIADLDFIQTPLEDLISAGVEKSEDIENPVLNVNYFIDPKDLRKSRAALEEYVAQVNKLLFTYFKNDKRLHGPFMKLLSVMQQAMDYIDLVYGGSKLGEGNRGELGDIRSEMDKRTIADIRVQPPEGGPRKSENLFITPSHYESYIQIYKTPEAAMENYHRYTKLAEKRNRTKAEQKEYEKRKRIDDLAGDFDKSHRYMLEKNSYSQQDADYAFSLAKKQQNADVHGNINIHLAGEIYQALIFEKIFGGIKQRFKNHITSVADAKDRDVVRNWLDNDLHECISRKKEDMKTVIRAIKRSEEDADEAIVLSKLSTVVSNRWLETVFSNNKNNDFKIDKAKNNISIGWRTLVGDKTSKTGAILDNLIQEVMQEDNLIPA